MYADLNYTSRSIEDISLMTPNCDNENSIWSCGQRIYKVYARPTNLIDISFLPYGHKHERQLA